jgi:hypothetical protein
MKLKGSSISMKLNVPSMSTSLPCMHYQWENCPITWQKQFQDKDNHRSIIFEAIGDQSFWIWHVYFSFPCNNKDINVLDRSPLITNLLQGLAQDMAIHIQSTNHLIMESIFDGTSLFKQFMSHKERKGNIFLKCKNE